MQKRVVLTKFDIYVFITITGSIPLLGTISPRGYHSPSSQCFELTWFIRYIYYWNLQFPNNVIINKTKILLPQV
jgi:hypothetical protein